MDRVPVGYSEEVLSFIGGPLDEQGPEAPLGRPQIQIPPSPPPTDTDGHLRALQARFYQAQILLSYSSNYPSIL